MSTGQQQTGHPANTNVRKYGSSNDAADVLKKSLPAAIPEDELGHYRYQSKSPAKLRRPEKERERCLPSVYASRGPSPPHRLVLGRVEQPARRFKPTIGSTDQQRYGKVGPVAVSFCFISTKSLLVAARLHCACSTEIVPGGSPGPSAMQFRRQTAPTGTRLSGGE